MDIRKNIVALLIASSFFGTSYSYAADKIGISLPSQNDFRQYRDGPQLVDALQKAGFETVLYYGGDSDVPIQQRQIERMVNEDHCNVLIISPIDDSSLGDVLQVAKKAGVPVIAYEKIIKKSDAVKFLVGYDAAAAGRIQAESIISALNVGMRSDPPNIEYFAGSPSDDSASLNYSGMEETMSRYVYSGDIKIPSQETDFKKVAIPNWSREDALKRMDRLIESQGYSPSGKKLDGVWAASDEIASGVISSLKKHGYTDAELPYITGMDASANSIQDILAGKRCSTVYRDPMLLHEATVKTVEALIKGETPESNNVYYDDETDIEVPAYYCEPVLVTSANAKEIADASGVLEQDQEH